MKCLRRNKQKIYHAEYIEKTEILDENGLKTGEFINSYTDPAELMVNVSAAKGTSELEQFGVNADYTHTFVTDDMTCPINEHSVIWYGITPENGRGHNYVVRTVARSLNSITYAIKEVSTT